MTATENPLRPGVELGAVYFRKTNPPAQDWERDFAVAAADGHTLFRHWVPWGAVEVAPGQYDWADYDRLLDLGRANGIATVLAELITDVPEWLYHGVPEARREMANGTRRTSDMHISCVTGGHHAMCLDNPEVAEAAGRFLRALAARYRDHPGLYAYDIWNECSHYHPSLICYCPATQARFRSWLQRKYQSLDALAVAWLRYSYTSWDQVELPRTTGPYPDVLDAVAFQNDNAFAWMQWRAEQIKAEDDVHPVAAHGNGKSHADIAPACGDDWRAGEIADIFGYTYWYANDCHPLLAGDMIRSASAGKRFWRAEAVGDSNWVDRRVGGRWVGHQDRMSDPANIRLDCMLSLAAGARGYLNPRWRPLLDGPLFDAFGWYGLDGGRTERSEMIRAIGDWATDPATDALWRSAPVTGQVGLVLLESAQAYCYAAHGTTERYSWSLQGAYEAFLHEHIQCDVIKLDQIDRYRLLYLPYALALSQDQLARLTKWVQAGGTLVTEGAFGFFSEHAHAFAEQPSRGLAKLLGCEQEHISFGAERWEDLTIEDGQRLLPVGLVRQTFTPLGGTVTGRYADGAAAIVDHQSGAGRTRAIGSMPGYGYKRHPTPEAAAWFGSALTLAGFSPEFTVDRPEIIARRSSTGKETFLWLVNQSPEAIRATVTFADDPGELGAPVAIRGEQPTEHSAQSLRVTVAGRDATILAFAG